MANGKSIHGPSQRALRVGDPCDDETRENQWVERGTIIAVYPNSLTCDIISERHGRLTGVPLPGLSQDPQGAGGHIEIPRPGQGVILQRGLGLPHILSILPMSVSRTIDRSTCPTILGLGAGSSSPTASPASYLGCLPVGLLPGDWIQLGNQGQFLGVFDQGAVGLYAGAWSHVMGSLEGDTLNISGRNLNVRTGAGQLTCKDYGGKQSVLLQLGTDQTTETGVDKGNYPLTVRLGGESKGLLDLIIADRIGNSVYEHIIDASGKVTHEETGPSINTYKQLVADTYGGDLNVEIQGSESRSVVGDQIDIINGSLARNVSQNIQSQVLNDRFDGINRNWDVSVGRNMSIYVSGDPVLSTPLTHSLHVAAANGSVSFDVGNPLAGDTGKSLSGFKVNTHGLGGIELLAKEFGLITIDSALPAASVWIGASTLNPKFEPAVLGLKLISLLTQMLILFDTHTHMILLPVPETPTMIPTVPMTPAIAANLPFLTSMKVMIGS